MNERKRSNNKFWIIILCVLATIMVGLIAGIVVVQVNRSNQIASEEEGEEEESPSGEGKVDPLIIDENSGEGETDDGGESGEGEGNSGISGEPNESEEQREKTNEQVAIENAVKEYISSLSVDEALSYLDTQVMRYEDDANNKFAMLLIKINVLNNADRHEDALTEALKIDNVEEFSKWNKVEYYNMMAYTYQVLGDTEKENEYGNLYIQAYKDLWGNFGGSY